MNTYTAHATMRDGTARHVVVTAADQVEARRRMFALSRAIASLTTPRSSSRVDPPRRVEYMRRAGDDIT